MPIHRLCLRLTSIFWSPMSTIIRNVRKFEHFDIDLNCDVINELYAKFARCLESSLRTPTCLCVKTVSVLAGTSASVFVSDQLEPTFQTLGSRQCLPADFVHPALDTAIAAACATKVTTGALPAQCNGTPVLALFYNCIPTT